MRICITTLNFWINGKNTMFSFNSHKQLGLVGCADLRPIRVIEAGYWSTETIISANNQNPMQMASFYKESGL